MKSKKKISKISIISKTITIKEKNKMKINTSNSTNKITLTEPSTEHSQIINNLPPIKQKNILNKEEKESNKTIQK